MNDGVKHVVLDYQGIVINQVGEIRSEGSFIDLTSNLASYTDTHLGSALIIQLNRTLVKDENITIRIHYYTNTDAKAMSWMNEEQTATKLLKYMFT